MRCYNCEQGVPDNKAFHELSDEGYDKVVEYYGLIHLQGPKDQFEMDGTVVICRECIGKAIADGTEQTRSSSVS